MPDVVKRHDEGAEREMNKPIQETADHTFLAKHDEELHPDARVKDVRKAGDQEKERREFLDGDFHDFYSASEGRASARPIFVRDLTLGRAEARPSVTRRSVRERG